MVNVNPGAQSASEADTVNFRDMFAVLLRRKFTCLIVGALVMSWAVKNALTTPPTFVSVSKIVCKTSEGSDAGLSQLAAMAGLNLNRPGTSNPAVYFEDILTDDEFLEAMLDRKWRLKGDSLTMAEIWKMQPEKGKRDDWEYVFRKRQVTMLRNSGILRLKRNKNAVFEIITQFNDPVVAYDVNRYTIDWLNLYLLKAFRTQARENRMFIEERIREVSAELEQTENSLAEFRERNLGVAAPKIMMQMGRLTRTLSVNQEIFLQLRKQVELAKIEELKDQPLIEVISKPVIAVDRTKPRRKQIVMLGAFLGAILGVGSAFFHHWFARMLAKPATRP